MTSKNCTDIEIRVLENSDLAVFGIIRDYLTAFNEKALGVKRQTALMAAYIDGEVVGGVSYRWYAQSAFLDYVAVGEKWQRQGIGKKLLMAVEEELRRQGCLQICVDTEAFQAPNFYQGLGYSLVTSVPNYICGYDQFILRKTL